MSEAVQALQEELTALRAECALLRTQQEQMLAERKESDSRLQGLLEQSQLLVREMDVRPLIAHFQALRAQGVTDFNAYFDTHPEEVLRCAEKVRLRFANRNILNFYGAKDGEELQEALIREMLPEHQKI